MFAYCNNNPAGYKDVTGTLPVWIVGEFAANAILGAIASYAGAALTAKIAGEDFNKGEALLWALADGVLLGFSAVCSPFNMMRVRYLQVAGTVVQGIVNQDELWEIALSAGLTYSTSKLSSAGLGTTIDTMIAFGADAVEGVVDVGKNNVDTTTEMTNPTYKNPATSTQTPSTRVNSTVTNARSRTSSAPYSNNPRSHLYKNR